MKKNISYSVLFMMALTLVFTLLLAFLNDITKTAVENNNRLELRRKILYVFDKLDGNEETTKINEIFEKEVEEIDKDDTKIYALKSGQETKAYAVPFEGPGLWGSITGYIGVTSDSSKVTGVEFITQSETPGLGGRISESPYKEQYRGIDIANPVDGKYVINRPANGGNIDAIAGATQTSTFVINMINEDLAKFIKEGGK